jgi:hypothetical protein
MIWPQNFLTRPNLCVSGKSGGARRAGRPPDRIRRANRAISSKGTIPAGRQKIGRQGRFPSPRRATGRALVHQLSEFSGRLKDSMSAEFFEVGSVRGRHEMGVGDRFFPGHPLTRRGPHPRRSPVEMRRRRGRIAGIDRRLVGPAWPRVSRCAGSAFVMQALRLPLPAPRDASAGSADSFRLPRRSCGRGDEPCLRDARPGRPRSALRRGASSTPG